MSDYLLYIQSVVERLKEEAREEKVELDREKNINTAFHQGFATGYYRAISIMKLEAELMQIPLSELKLDDINPDSELL